MKKIILTCFVVLIGIGETFAQKNIGLGLTIGAGEGKEANKTDSFGSPINPNRAMSYVGFLAVYRSNTLQVGPGGVGLNIPATIGLANSQLYFDASAIVHYQLGALSSTENYEKKGYYFGGGIGITHATWEPVVTGTSQIPTLTVNSFTPILEAGTRIRVGRAESYTDVAFFYKFNSNPEPKHNIYGIKLLYYIK